MNTKVISRPNYNIRSWFVFEKIEPAKDLSFGETLRYLEDDLQASKKYHQKIMLLAGISVGLWVAIMLILAYRNGVATFFRVEIYPSVLWAILTGAFGEMEMLDKKRRFQEFLADANIQNDAITKDKIQDALWDEFKNLAK